MSRTAALLGVLVRGAHDDTLRAVLHDDVEFVRGDGARIVGRDAVAAMFASSDAARYEVLSTIGDTLMVALTAEGAPGAIVFVLSGALREDMLCDVRVTLG